MVIGAGAAVVSAVTGVFTVMRGQSFAGHALADVSSAGGAASFLLGINPLLGFLGMAVLAAGGMEFSASAAPASATWSPASCWAPGSGSRRLFLYFDVTPRSTTGAANIGDVRLDVRDPGFDRSAGSRGRPSRLRSAGLLYRPLLLSSLYPDLARHPRHPVRLIGLLHLLTPWRSR